MKGNDICPFCQQPTITHEFRAKLGQYFDDSYKIAVKKQDELQQRFSQLTSDLMVKLEQIEAQERLKKDTFLDRDSFSNLVKAFEAHVMANREMIAQKMKEPSRSIKLITSEDVTEQIESLIDVANQRVRKHNELVDNFNVEKLKLTHAIWKFIAEEGRPQIEAYEKSQSALKKGIDAITLQLERKRKEYHTLNQGIQELNKTLTSVQPAVDEINRTLKQYGFHNFSIKPSKEVENHYQIRHEDGSLAVSTLSEGEITFITFLYFLQLVKGDTNKEAINEDRILVVDDPISSLDSTVLFVVSSLLKDIIKGVRDDQGRIRQVFILTHINKGYD